MSDWFENWFETKFYHILYRNRDENEAKVLLENLISELPIRTSDHVHDMACGSGRHSHYLGELGFKITGTDLSAKSIAKAQETAGDNMNFFVHDMRFPQEGAKYDVVLNLFTSFGYFDSFEENLAVLKAVRENLADQGQICLDYLNANRADHPDDRIQTKSHGDIEFQISKTLSDGMIIKEIKVVENGSEQTFVEKVQLYSLADFEKLFSAAGLKVDRIFGDYQLNEFTANSERLIIIGSIAE